MVIVAVSSSSSSPSSGIVVFSGWESVVVGCAVAWLLVSVVADCAVTGLLASVVREVVSIVLAGESVSVVSRL